MSISTLAAAAAAVLMVLSLPLCLQGTPVEPQARMRKLVRAPRATRVESNYFIHMKDTVSFEQMKNFTEHLENEASTDPEFNGVKINGLAYLAAHGFTAHLSESALNEVRESQLVDFAEEDQIVRAGRIAPTWGLDRLDQTSYSNNDYTYTPPCNLTGAGVDVYVLDSGIRYSHNTFGGRAIYPGCDPIDQLKSTNRSGLDCTGHGTHVAGIVGGNVTGVAPGATIFSVRVLTCDNTGTFNTIVMGVECVLRKVEERKRPSIVNLSIYGPKNYAMKRAIDNLMKKGITVVTIAGNNHDKPKDSCKVSPASIHGLITVSASTNADQAHFQSNAGVCVDLYAPGITIKSASNSCDTCYSDRSGSSMAAPHVAGALALLFERCPLITPWRARHILLSQLVLVNKLDFSSLPNKFKPVTPNLLLHTSNMNCSPQC